jgi:eukaryotic-like serine/threonine-protein kinase
MTSPGASLDNDPMDAVAESFLERWRQGERPALSEYTQKHPELAERILKLFPALLIMEELGPEAQSAVAKATDCGVAGERAPQQLGEYRVLRELGRGGMGVVYEALQESLGRHVALKVLPFNSLLGPTHLERFRREARAAARLHHSNIVPVFGVGEHEGFHYYAMQFIQGQSLDLVLEEVRALRGQSQSERDLHLNRGEGLVETVAGSLITGRFAATGNAAHRVEPGPAVNELGLQNPEFTVVMSDSHRGSDRPADGKPRSGSPASSPRSGLSALPEVQYFRSVARVGLQVAEALAYAHRTGIVHRDIKPSNLLLDLRGTVWVTDFGLAKAEGNDELTSPGDIVGTVSYMAPERFHGHTDPRSDVYGLGITLYEMLCLRPAFSDTHRARLIDRVAREDPVPPRSLDWRIPRDLETIVLKAVAKDPSERYDTAEAFGEDMRRFLGDRTIQARRATMWEQAVRWCRRNRAVAGLTGLVALLLITVAVETSIAFFTTRRQLYLTQLAQNEATSRLFRSLVDQARASRLSQRMGQSFGTLAAVRDAARVARDIPVSAEQRLELRNQAVACLALPDMRIAGEGQALEPGTVRIDVADDFTRYARCNVQGNVSVRRLDDDREFCRFTSELAEPGVEFSQNGRLIALTSAVRAEVWLVSLTEPIRIYRSEDCLTFSFAPDGRRFAVAHGDGSISFHEAENGRETGRVSSGMNIHAMAFHPDSMQLAYSVPVGVRVLDLASSKIVAELRQNRPQWLAWHRDGKMLAAADEDMAIVLWNVVRRVPIHKLVGCKSSGIYGTFSRNGDLLAALAWDGAVRLWSVRTGEEIFHAPGRWGTRLKFGPGDRLLGPQVHGSTFGFWELADRRVYRTLTRDPALGDCNYYRSSASPTPGRLLAVGGSDGIGFWDLQTGDALCYLQMGKVENAIFDPSGSLLVEGPSGLERWPIEEDPAARGVVHVRAPRPLPIPASVDGLLAQSVDGRVVASAQGWGALVLHLDRPEQPIRLGPHNDTRRVAVSADGKWVATGSHFHGGVKIWDAENGRLIRELPAGKVCVPTFSPDGRWLLISDEHLLGFWSLPDWRPVREQRFSAPAVAFAPDGKLLAVETGEGSIAIVDPDTGRENVRLEDPSRDRAVALAFSHDASYLIAKGTGNGRLQVWDLRLIRTHLMELGLDWEVPAHPSPGEGRESAESAAPGALNLAIEFDQLPAQSATARGFAPPGITSAIAFCNSVIKTQPGSSEALHQRAQAHALLEEWSPALADSNAALALDPDRVATYYLRGQIHERLGNDRQAAVDLGEAIRREPLRAPSLVEVQQALGLDPRSAESHNNLAWTHLTQPEERRVAGLAALLAEKAVLLAPTEWSYRNTLALAYHRLGRWARTIEELQQGIKNNEGRATAFDLYLLSLSYARLGQPSRARECLDQANAWWNERAGLAPGYVFDLTKLREEATALLAPVERIASPALTQPRAAKEP